MGERLSLKELGMVEGWIYEVILTTYDEDKNPNAAPMGVQLQGSRLLVKPFTSTKTFKNLVAFRSAVANIVYDPLLFYRTAFKEVNPGGTLPPQWFEAAGGVEAPRLRDAQAHIELLVEEIREGVRGEVKARIVGIDGRPVPPTPYCRGAFASIEAIIHATRIKEFLSQGLIGEAEDLIGLVKYYRDLVLRVTPHSNHSKIIESILEMVEEWRKG